MRHQLQNEAQKQILVTTGMMEALNALQENDGSDIDYSNIINSVNEKLDEIYNLVEKMNVI